MSFSRISRRMGAAMGAVTVAIVAVAATGTAQTGTPPEFTNGRASAQAQAYKINPTAASLSLGVTFGISLAGYQNQVAKAESRGIDLGIIGTTLAGEPCDGGEPTFPADKQPQPLTADSRDPESNAGKTANETFYSEEVPFITKTVKATDQPHGEATTLTMAGGQAGALEMGAARTGAVTRVVDGNVREAVGTADIGTLVLGGGVVRLGGLHWEAVHRSGSTETVHGGFSIGSITVGGVPLPIPSSGDLSAPFAVANTALAPLGLVLTPPATRVQGANVYVDPLVVGVVPSATRDQVAGTLLGAAQPVREQVVAAILAQDCGNDSYVLVADIALGTVTGAGSLSYELGGVQAGTDEIRGSSLLGGRGTALGGGDSLPLALPASGAGLGTLPASGSIGLPASTPVPTVVAPTPIRPQVAAPVSVSSAVGTRGGRLALVALVGLLLLAAVAEADRRKMRRAQRMIPEV